MSQDECFAFQNLDGTIDVDSVADSRDAVKHRLLEGFMGWRYEHPERYNQDEQWERICEPTNSHRTRLSERRTV